MNTTDSIGVIKTIWNVQYKVSLFHPFTSKFKRLGCIRMKYNFYRIYMNLKALLKREKQGLYYLFLKVAIKCQNYLIYKYIRKFVLNYERLFSVHQQLLNHENSCL